MGPRTCGCHTHLRCEQRVARGRLVINGERLLQRLRQGAEHALARANVLVKALYTREGLGQCASQSMRAAASVGSSERVQQRAWGAASVGSSERGEQRAWGAASAGSSERGEHAHEALTRWRSSSRGFEPPYGYCKREDRRDVAKLGGGGEVEETKSW